MRLWVALLFGWCAGLACAADAVQVEVRRDNGKILLSAVFLVPVPRAVAWAVLTDFEHMPQFLPNLKSSRVLFRDGQFLRVAQQGVIPLLMLDFSYESIREITLNPMQALSSRSVGGNAGTMQANTVLDIRNQQTQVQYSAVWSPSSALVGALGLDIMREQVNGQFLAMQQEMLKRAKNQPAFPTVSQMNP